jgi:hypothetical protein
MLMAADQVFAEHFSMLADKVDTLIWPTLTYGVYPAFAAYAGSVSLPGMRRAAASAILRLRRPTRVDGCWRRWSRI